jgi:hypothetical protein
MPVFAVIAPQHDVLLHNLVIQKFPKHFQFSPGQYVVNAPGPTAQTIALAIDPTGQTTGRFVVFSVAGYWGYHEKNLWEWLTLNSG